MFKFKKDTKIEELPANVFRDLVIALSLNNFWKILAQHACDMLNFSRYIMKKFKFSFFFNYVSLISFLSCGSFWLKDLEIRATTNKESPANELLLELNIQNCDVRILCEMLNNCHLLTVLTILQEPGMKRLSYLTV